MLTLSRSVRREAGGGDPLPAPFRTWDERGIRFRRSSVSMLAGVPGSFKTAITLNAVANMGVSTLFFSTDSSIETVRARLLAIATGETTEKTESWAHTQPDRAESALQRFDFIAWDFRPDPTLDDIWLSAYAYHEREGMWPAQIVVDIASDIGHDTGDEWGSLRDLMRQAKVLARETGAHVLLVHHASDSERTKKPCPRRSDIHGKVAAIPELIITCGLDAGGRLNVACVKNRHAKASADAEDFFPMELRANSAFVGDFIQPAFAGYEHAHTGDEGDWWK